MTNKEASDILKRIRDGLDEMVELNNKSREAFDAALAALEAERKTGKWIPVTRIEEWHQEEGLIGFPPEAREFPICTVKYVDATEPDEVDAVRCSECGAIFDFADARNWCSECGAKMNEGKQA